MRLARFDLQRYGRFTDASLPLPRAGGADLHVIYGPNEAGKSTSRKALAELLFGFEKSTPYNFLHSYSELRLGALVEVGDQSLEVVRKKANRQSLLDAAGQPIEEARWREVIGAADRPFFERMFALDHGLLIEGGKDMLDSRSDIGRMLFQAAAGLSHFNQVRAAMGTEAATWWAPRARKDVRYFEARARLEAANRALKEHALTESALASLQREWAQFDAKTRAARGQLMEAQGRIAQLERIRRLAPKCRQLARVEVECVAVTANALLPVEARETYRTYAQETATADTAAGELTETIDDLVQRREALEVDDALMAQEEAIEAISRDLNVVEEQIGDLPARKQSREQLRRDLAQALADLGFPAMEPAEIGSRLPGAPQREQLRALAAEHAEHAKALAARAATKEAADRKLVGLRNEVGRLPGDDDRALGELISAASGVLEGGNARQLAEATQVADANARNAVEALGWTGTPATLRAMVPPPVADIAARLEHVGAQRSIIADLARSRREADTDAAQAQAQVTTLRQEAVPDAEALHGARTERDGIWAELRGGHRSVSDDGAAFERLVLTADDIADRRYADAQGAARMDDLQATLAGLRARAQILAAQQTAAEQVLQQLTANWDRDASAAGLVGVALDGAGAWFERRRTALQALDIAERTGQAWREFTATAEREARRLEQALGRTAPSGVDAGAWLQTLRNEARQAEQAASQERTRRDGLAKQIAEQEHVIAAEQSAEDALSVKRETWQVAWSTACTQAGLPAQTLPQSLDRLLEQIQDLRAKAAQFTELVEARIEPMKRNIRAFGERVHNCVAAAAPTLVDRDPLKAAHALVKNLQVARTAAASRTNVNENIEVQRVKLRNQQQKKVAAVERLKPLLHLAGVTDPTALDAAITASDLRRHLDAKREELTETILELGEGLDLAQLRTEVASVALDQLEGLLADARQAHATAEAQQHDAHAQTVLAKERLKQREGNDHAARARAAKASAQREMADAVETYVGLQTQVQLLDWALKRYREEKQGPLLQRASDYFAQLTCGEHVRLLAEEEGATVTLASRRAGPAVETLTVGAMSEGTLDQLYLALRLAALELHLERNVALPFVADDLLINFDDTRAKAALGCLATLSRRTQVLYFTHHRHLLDLAREACGTEVNIIEL